jgi:hypothetical protein
MIICLTNAQINLPPEQKEIKITLQSTQEEVAAWMTNNFPQPFTWTKIGKSDHLRSVKGGFEI